MISKPDVFSYSFSSYKRLHQASARLNIIGQIPRKTSKINCAFESLNYSFILQGRGTYQYGSEPTVNVEAPCVLTQWPQEMMNYGPLPGESWHELYLIYPCEDIAFLQNAGLFTHKKVRWNVQRTAEFYQAIRNLIQAVQKPYDPASADLIDHLAQSAILYSLLPQREKPGADTTVIEQIRQQVDNDCTQSFDFDELAVDHGMSPSFFRKRWKEHVGLPPHSYVCEKRMELARNMLLQTNLPIAQIAAAAGYSDPLYFSRIFSKIHSMSPRNFRYSNGI